MSAATTTTALVAVLTVTPFVVAVLKFTFLAFLCFFVWRVARTTVVDMRAPRSSRATAGASASAVGNGRGGHGGAKRAKPQRGARGKVPVIVYIRDQDGNKTGSQKLKGPMQIGRDEACELRPDDTYLSQFHARFAPRDGVWFLEDLGSTNGTYLNQQRITGPVEVHAGDVVKIGTTTLELRR